MKKVGGALKVDLLFLARACIWVLHRARAFCGRGEKLCDKQHVPDESLVREDPLVCVKPVPSLHMGIAWGLHSKETWF